MAWWEAVPVIIVTGPVGAGKITTGDALAGWMARRGVPAWLMDVDRLSDITVRSPGDRFAMGVVLSSLKQVWAVSRAAGARVAILPYVVESDEEVRQLVEAIPQGFPWVVRLSVSLAVVNARIAGREDGDSRLWHLNRAAELQAIMEKAAVGDLVVDGDSASPEALAELIGSAFIAQHPELCL